MQETGQSRRSRHLRKELLLLSIMMSVVLWWEVFCLRNHHYYIGSLVIIGYTLLVFFLAFEKRKPQTREVVVVAVLIALGVTGRAAFFMLPQFKPVAAIVIISGVCLGGEVGFVVGAMTAFVSNIFFGQGPWTPWQMIAFGMIGFLAGILAEKKVLKKDKCSLCIFGGLATFFIYGGIMNPCSVLMFTSKPTVGAFIAAYISGLWFDIIHSMATVIFLWYLTTSMLQKLERVKKKYGLMNLD